MIARLCNCCGNQAGGFWWGSTEQTAAFSRCWTSFSRSSSLQRRSYSSLINLRGVTLGRRCRIISQVVIKKSSCAQQCNYLFCPVKMTHLAVATQTRSEQASDPLVLNVGGCEHREGIKWWCSNVLLPVCTIKKAANVIVQHSCGPEMIPLFMCFNTAVSTSPFSLDVCCPLPEKHLTQLHIPGRRTENCVSTERQAYLFIFLPLQPIYWL